MTFQKPPEHPKEQNPAPRANAGTGLKTFNNQYPIDTTEQEAAKASKRKAQDALSSAVASILKTVPKKQLSIGGLDSVFERVTDRRARAEWSAVPDRDAIDPTDAPWYSPLKRKTRECIAPMLDDAIEASGLNAKDARCAVFAPLQALEKYNDTSFWPVILKSQQRV